MERVPEPDLMNEEEQVCAYALADFEEPHSRFVRLFQETFPEDISGYVLDLGCGPGDITLRFARAFPRCTIDGVDGAPNMLRFGREAAARTGLAERVRFIQGYLPGARLPQEQYDIVISNSLLHHLASPAVLWDGIKRWARPEAPVFVMDLMRPESPHEAEALVEAYAAGEPEVLKRDFFHSLLAAYRPGEVREQLEQAGLTQLSVQVVSDRHVVMAGRR
jgi:ubiquinone/menaquinone biosynthesis C-methylase UbiE